MQPSRRSQRGLDWFAFFLADVQTGWGPFVAAYLTSVAWTQLDIGLILTIGTLTGLAMQIPVGALVDRVPAKRLLAALAVFAISASALLLALWPAFGVVVVAKVLHAIASSLTGPVLAAISLGLVGHAAFSVRLGRNARYLALGNAIAAGAMGALAYYFSNRAIFFLTAALAIPTLIALAQIQSSEIDPDLARGGVRKSDPGSWFDAIASLAQPRAVDLCRHDRAVPARQCSNAADHGRPIDDARARMGHACPGDLHSRAAIPGRSHRALGRAQGAELGSASAAGFVLRGIVDPGHRVRGDK